MEITRATEKDRATWNRFISENYPPVGAFMQTWEWGDFKLSSGKKTDRFLLSLNGQLVGVFTFVEHILPLGLRYGYVPRGPVVSRVFQTKEEWLKIFSIIRAWLNKEFPYLLFVRLEPPASELPDDLFRQGFRQPNYYIQPRYNHTIPLDGSEEDILQNFHPSTRSNINRGVRRGVTIEVRDHTQGDHYNIFHSIAKDTIDRNKGLSIYPGRNYFSSLFKTVPPYQGNHIPDKLTLATFYGYQNGELAAIHFVLFFGRTATYLYGASSTAHLSSKVTTCLHYAAMKEARLRGMKYYDLGGIDEKLWPSLTRFKRQFQGQEFSYVGNVDVPINYFLYYLYNLLQNFRRIK